MAEAEMTTDEAATLMAQVFALVRACPAGRATTYGALAKAIGHPRGARMVGWIMNEEGTDVPAQRVVNSQGELSGSWAFATPDAMRSRRGAISGRWPRGPETLRLGADARPRCANTGGSAGTRGC